MTLFSAITPDQRQALRFCHNCLLCIATPVLIALIGYLTDVFVIDALSDRFRFNKIYEWLQIVVPVSYYLAPFAPLCLGLAWLFLQRIMQDRPISFWVAFVIMLPATIVIFLGQISAAFLITTMFFDISKLLPVLLITSVTVFLIVICILSILTNLLLFWVLLKQLIRRVWHPDQYMDQVFD